MKTDNLTIEDFPENEAGPGGTNVRLEIDYLDESTGAPVIRMVYLTDRENVGTDNDPRIRVYGKICHKPPYEGGEDILLSGFLRVTDLAHNGVIFRKSR